MKYEHNKEYIIQLAGKFDNRTLSKEDWTHEAHLTVAIWYLSTFDFFEALCRIKSGIIILNHVHGTANTGRSGYHETLTIFWSKVIHEYISLNREAPVEQLVNGFLGSPLANKNLPFEFYEKAILLSSGPRSVYSDPHLKEFDGFAIHSILAKAAAMRGL